MAKTPKAESRDIESILNNPSDKAKLQNFLDEAVRCKTRISDENEAIKSLKDEAKEKLGLDPKMFNQLVKIAYDNSAQETQANISALESAIELLFGSNGE